VSVPHNYFLCYIAQPVWQSSNENQCSNGKSTRNPRLRIGSVLEGVWPGSGAPRAAFPVWQRL